MHSTSLQRLQSNRLMRSESEMRAFEAALEDIAADRDPALLPELHLVLDDNCHQHEVMFGLIHLLESFDVDAQLQAFLDVLPRLIEQASSWTRVLHFRILNDDEARPCYTRLVRRAGQSSHSCASAILMVIAREEEEPLRSAAVSVLRAMAT